MSYDDELSESDSVSDCLATGREDEGAEASRYTLQSWSADESKGEELTRESYRQWHQSLLEEDEKNHAMLLKR